MERRDLVILSLYQLLANNRSGLFLVYVPLFLTIAKGAPIPVALGFVSAAYVASSLLGPVAGRVSDRIGRRRPFLLAAEVGAFPLFLAIPYVPGYWAAGTMFLLAQAVLSMGAPALNAYVTDLTGLNERGAGFGLLNATGFSGAAAGFVASAVFIELWGYDALFWFVALVMVGTISIVLFFVPDRSVPPSAQRQAWGELRPLATFSVAVSFRALGWGAVGTFVGILAYELHADPLEIALVAVTGVAAAALTSIAGGSYVDRRGEMAAIWWGSALSVAGIVPFFLATNWTELIPAQILRYVGFTYLSPGMLAYVANRAPEGHRAEHMGIFSLVNSTFWSLGPLAGGIVLGLSGNRGLFAFAIGCTVVSLIALEAMYSARRRRAPGAPPATNSPPAPT